MTRGLGLELKCKEVTWIICGVGVDKGGLEWRGNPSTPFSILLRFLLPLPHPFVPSPDHSSLVCTNHLPSRGVCGFVLKYGGLWGRSEVKTRHMKS